MPLGDARSRRLKPADKDFKIADPCGLLLRKIGVGAAVEVICERRDGYVGILASKITK